MDLLVSQIVDLVKSWNTSEMETQVARTSRRMSETVLGKGASESPGALDTKVRHKFYFSPRLLTWHGSRQG